MKRRTKIALGPKDAAVVFRASGNVEISIPEGREDEIVPPHVMNATRAAVLMKCPQAVAIMDEFLQGMRKQN